MWLRRGPPSAVRQRRRGEPSRVVAARAGGREQVAGHGPAADISGHGARTGPGRRPRADWERGVEHAIRHLRSAWDLQDNSLWRTAAVQDRASHSYRGRPGAEAQALRDLVEEAVSLASDLLAPPYETFLRRWVAKENVAAVTREIGRDRSHLSRDYRPRVVMVVTDVFMKLTGSGEHRNANTRPRRTRRAR